MQELDYWHILLIKGGAFDDAEFEFAAPDDQLLDLSGRLLRILVKWNNGLNALEWTTGGGHIEIVPGTDNRRARLVLTVEQINALVFKAASFYFFLDGEQDYVTEGTITVK